MKTLLADIYNKIMDLFQIERSENTSECAANRLQVILMHDRTKLDPLIMNKMREELIDVFSKYVVIDKEELEIGLKNEGDAVALMLNIPIVRAKTEEELEEIRNKLQQEETKVEDDDTSEEEAAENENEAAAEEEKEAAESDEDTINEDVDVIVEEESENIIVEETTEQTSDKSEKKKQPDTKAVDNEEQQPDL